MRTCFTVVTRTTAQYAKYFRVLHHSIRRFHPDVRIVVYTFGDDNFPLPDDIDRRPTGTHSDLLQHCWPEIARDGLSYGLPVVLLGADFELFTPLDRALDAARDHDLLLVPHLSTPLNLGSPLHPYHPEEFLFAVGACNTDFAVLQSSQNMDNILNWLRSRIDYRFGMNLAAGLFNEQSWLSMTYCLFPKVKFWRNQCYNVARWNFDTYGLRLERGAWVTNEGPLGAFHWSRFNMDEPKRLHPPPCPYMLEGEVASFFEGYAERVRSLS